MTDFHYFSLEEVFEYAERMGYSREDVEVEQMSEDEYEVSFGHEYTEMWFWSFKSLEEVAFDYEHLVWED